MVPSTFDFHLEPSGDSAPDPRALVALLRGESCLFWTRGEDSHVPYRNEETSAHFRLILGEALQDELRRTWRRSADGDAPDDGPLDGEAFDEEPAAEEDEVEDEASDEEDAGELPHQPYLVASVPLFRPSFFLDEALELARRVLAAGSLKLIDPHSPETDEHGRGTTTPARAVLASSWRQLHEEVYTELADRLKIEEWSEEKGRDFHAYTSARVALEASLAPAAVAVPRLVPVRHKGRIATMSLWNTSKSTVLPRCDLLLLQEPKEKRGLFRTRVVTSERIVDGGKVWNILASRSEFRTVPAPHYLFRRPRELPQDVERALAELEGEPAESASRTELAAVVDFPLSAKRQGAGAEARSEG